MDPADQLNEKQFIEIENFDTSLGKVTFLLPAVLANSNNTNRHWNVWSPFWDAMRSTNQRTSSCKDSAFTEIWVGNDRVFT
jgi:hypothetical protein